ncbi:MAG: DUF3078 domain-containing protein [Paludibacteraceae bacterium]|nr:DUF3078 domain-containing protein [Paludibacteraceae bacterium]
MRRLRLFIVVFSLFTLSTAAIALPEEADTVVVMHQYADTLRLQDAQQTVEFNDDDLLLELIARQSRLIADSLAALDSTQLNSEQARERMLAMQEQLRRDSLTIDSIRIDSIRIQTQRLIEEIGDRHVEVRDIRIEKHIVPDVEEDRADIRRAIRQQYSPWYRDARTLVQFTQNYITPNWYKGGTSSLAMLAILRGNLKYKKDNFVWENTGEWRMGLSTTGKADTVHKVNVTDDLFKLYSKAGYQVYKDKLLVSGALEFQTTLLPSWQTNSQKLKSGFMTPVRFNLTLGLDYKPVDWVTINFSPANYKLVHATIYDPERVTVTDFGIDDGKKTLSEFGSSLRIEAKYKPLREIELYTLLYFYTNYRQVEFDWQIECDFIINRFLSTHLTLHPRFDSTVKSTEPQHIQFKELLSIGFNHYFR